MLPMDLINAALDVVVPPSGVLFLLFAYPVIAFFQFWSYVFRFFFYENVQGKVVLITGASSGIGEHIAYEYAKKGARLALVARRENMLREVGDRCRQLGAAHVHPIVADVAKEEDCRKFVDETINQFGHLDHLVCNAGLSSLFFFEEARDPSALYPVMDVTFWGSVFSTHYALPHLRRSKGKIVVIDSVASWLPFPRHSIYNAAKAGVLQFFDTLRVEVGNHVGITIVQPGATESELLRGKAVTPDGRVEMLPDEIRDTQFGPMPVTYAETVARATVQGALRGHRYVVVPFWYSVLLLYRIFAPELLTFCLRLLLTKVSDRKYITKAIMEQPGVKRAMYPESIIKSE